MRLIAAKNRRLPGLAGSRAGTQWLLQLKEKNKLPPELVAETGRLVAQQSVPGIYAIGP